AVVVMATSVTHGSMKAITRIRPSVVKRGPSLGDAKIDAPGGGNQVPALRSCDRRAVDRARLRGKPHEMDLDGTELREGTADLGDVSLHYVELGEGPLIVLLHGFPEFWYGWRLQIKPLADAGFRVVAPDMRGYNLSSRPADVKDYDTDHLTADIT